MRLRARWTANLANFRAAAPLATAADPCHSPPSTAGAALDRFSFFFAFYGLILGLAVTELLGGFAGMVRAHAVKKIEAQTALLALLTFVLIVATWVDAFSMSRGITLNFGDLWAPILLATFYYLAAAVVFPREQEQFAHLHAYFAARKTFIVGLLFAAEMVDHVTNYAFMADTYRHRPAEFWAWLLPYNAVIDVCLLALLLVRSRRANIALLAALIVLFLVPYWDQGAIDRLATGLWGY